MSRAQRGEVAERDAGQVGHAHEQDGAADAGGAGQRAADLAEGDPARWHAAEGPAVAGPLGECQQRQPAPAREPARSGRARRRAANIADSMTTSAR